MSTHLAEPEIEEERQLEEETESALEPPYKVLIHNDDVTPYEFVVHILNSIFQIKPLAAELITYTAHVAGVALVTVLPRSEAESKVGKAHFAAGLEGFPLHFTIEPEESG
jgi:ATP-dependent Clp protease adaptor protein ClpS